jgi:hypothetical protein
MPKFLSWQHGLGAFLEEVMSPTLEEEIFEFAMGRTPESRGDESVENCQEVAVTHSHGH